MSQKVFCKKYQKEMPRLLMPPIPGPKGKELQESISQEAWNKWKSHQTTLINEKPVSYTHLTLPTSYAV